MDSNELIDQMKVKTFFRIRDLMVSRYKEATTDQEMSEVVVGWDTMSSFELKEPPLELIEKLLKAPLYDVAVHLLWTIAAAANSNIFIASEENIAKVVGSIKLEEVVRVTGMKPEDASFTLEQMVESLVEIIRQETSVHFEIDHRKYQLCVLRVVNKSGAP